MIESKPANSNKPAPPAAYSPDRPIAMRRILFNLPPFDVPGKDAAGGLEAHASEGRRWEVTLYPWLRHYVITYYSHDAKQPPRVILVHESRVATAEPA